MKRRSSRRRVLPSWRRDSDFVWDDGIGEGEKADIPERNEAGDTSFFSPPKKKQRKKRVSNVKRKSTSTNKQKPMIQSIENPVPRIRNENGEMRENESVKPNAAKEEKEKAMRPKVGKFKSMRSNTIKEAKEKKEGATQSNTTKEAKEKAVRSITVKESIQLAQKKSPSLLSTEKKRYPVPKEYKEQQEEKKEIKKENATSGQHQVNFLILLFFTHSVI